MIMLCLYYIMKCQLNGLSYDMIDMQMVLKSVKKQIWDLKIKRNFSLIFF